MIKKIIIDLDDTLIINNKESIKDYVNVLKKYDSNCEYEDALKLYECIGKYELSVDYYDKEELLYFINNYFNKDYDISFIDDILNAVGNWCYLIPDNLIDTLEYLSSKYELYVLTNWFTSSQSKRLDKVNISKYFKEIVGPEKYVKPSVEAFKYFFKDSKPEECVMIGDRYEIDIEVPLKLGMKAYLFDRLNKYDNIDCKKFSDWKELKDIL